MTPEQLKELEVSFGKQAAEKMQAESDKIKTALKAEHEKVLEGFISKDDFEKKKAEQAEAFQKQLDKLEEASKEQGNKIAGIVTNAKPESKSLEQFIVEKGPEIKKALQEGKYIEYTATQLKAAGVIGVASGFGTITDATIPGNAYLPGLAGSGLELFEIVNNPNFILDQIDLGRTNSYRLAWINEKNEDGTITEVSEGAPKPKIDIEFETEISTAKKMAGYIHITDEFEQDLPQLATRVRRMLQERVLRAFDDTIQAAVIAAARPFEITDMNDSVDDANLWDAVYAMMAQVKKYNYMPNAVAINAITEALMKMSKATDGVYLLPSFASEITSRQSLANKVLPKHALVGDLKQYKVDIYKEFTLKAGLINDDLILNRSAIVGEIRYHRYISDIRKKALCYASLVEVKEDLDGTPPLS